MSKEKKGAMPGIIGKKIFIADVSGEMTRYQENLSKELQNYDCVIRSSADTNGNPDDIRTIIEDCDIAIHLLSNQDEEIGEDHKGVDETQIQISVQHYLSQKLVSDTVDNLFEIYAWYPKSNLTSIYEEERIPNHIKKIQQLDEVELIQTSYEDFKYYLLKKIEVDQEQTNDVDEYYIKGSDVLSIYFLYDAVDKEGATEYVDYLRQRGFIVFTPDFEGDIMSVRQMHNNCLRKYDIAIIFAEGASVNWISMKIMDIMKSPGLGREEPIRGKAILVSGEKELLLPMTKRSFDILTIGAYSAKEQMDKLLQRLD